jgi:hypothetical protein
MSITVIQLITDTLRMINVINANRAPSPEQGISTLHMLNEMMADWESSGLRLGWYPIADADISAVAPLADEDIRGVKLCLAIEVAPYFGIQPIQQLQENALDARQSLQKRYVQYLESDTSFLPMADAYGPYGPWPWLQ